MDKKTLTAIVYLKGGGITEVEPMLGIVQSDECADYINIIHGTEPHEYRTWSIHNVEKIEIK